MYTTIGIPARPDLPTVDSGRDSVVVMVTTQHSGVRDSAVDDFLFIVKVLVSLCSCACILVMHRTCLKYSKHHVLDHFSHA